MLKEAFARRPVFWGLLLAALVRIIVASPRLAPDPEQPSDIGRFLNQAEGLLHGDGFLAGGELCTSLPPGYPMFIAAVYALCHSAVFLVAVQFVLSLASCYLVYLAVRPRSNYLALTALVALAISPWVAHKVFHVLSETFGVFLMSLLVYEVSRYETGFRTPWRVFFLGVLAVFLVLTSPVAVYLAAGVCFVVACQNFRQPRNFFALAGGCLLVMAPWQVHCWCALGRPVPTVLSTDLGTNEGYLLWMRTWRLHARDLFPVKKYVYYGRTGVTIDRVPAYAFWSEQEREEMASLVEQWDREKVGRAERNETLGRLAAARIAESPLRYHLVLPLLRSIFLCTDMPKAWRGASEFVGRISVSAFQEDVKNYGQYKALRRLAKGIVSTGMFVLHLGYLLAWAVIAAGAVASKRPMAMVILLGVGLCIFTASYFGLEEPRRNIVFVPALLFLLFYLPPSFSRAADRVKRRLFRQEPLAQ